MKIKCLYCGRPNLSDQELCKSCGAPIPIMIYFGGERQSPMPWPTIEQQEKAMAMFADQEWLSKLIPWKANV